MAAQVVIVVIVVGLSAAYLGRVLYRYLFRPANTCGCSGCPSASKKAGDRPPDEMFTQNR